MPQGNAKDYGTTLQSIDRDQVRKENEYLKYDIVKKAKERDGAEIAAAGLSDDDVYNSIIDGGPDQVDQNLTKLGFDRSSVGKMMGSLSRFARWATGVPSNEPMNPTTIKEGLIRNAPNILATAASIAIPGGPAVRTGSGAFLNFVRGPGIQMAKSALASGAGQAVGQVVKEAGQAEELQRKQAGAPGDLPVVQDPAGRNKRVMGAAVEGVAYDALGNLIMHPLLRMVRGSGRPIGGVAGKELAETAKETGSRVTVGDRMKAGGETGGLINLAEGTARNFGMGVQWRKQNAAKAAEGGERVAKAKLDASFGANQNSTKLGRASSIKDTVISNSKAASEYGDALYDQLRKFEPGVTVQPQAMNQIANDILASKDAQAVYYEFLGKLADKEKNILTSIMSQPGPVPFAIARELRSVLLKAAPDIGDVAKNQTEVTAQRLAKALTDDMLTRANGQTSPQAVAAFNEARTYWQQYKDLYDDNPLFNQIKSTATPEMVFDLVKSNTESSFQGISKLLNDYPSRFGGAISQRSAKQSSDVLRKQFLSQNILGSSQGQPITEQALVSLNANLDKQGPEVLEAMFGDPQGREAIATLRRLGKLSEIVSAADPTGEGLKALMYQVRGLLGKVATTVAVPEIMAEWMLRGSSNPTFQKFLEEGLSRVPGVLKIADAAERTKAMSMLFRGLAAEYNSKKAKSAKDSRQGFKDNVNKQMEAGQATPQPGAEPPVEPGFKVFN